MQKGFLLNSRVDILKFINKVISDTPDLQKLVVSFNEKEVLFKQGENLPYLYLLLEGGVKLNRENDDGSSLDILTLEPGHFAGLVSFNTRNDSLTTAVALKPIKALRFSQDDFDEYLNNHPRLRHPMQQLMMSNMTDRLMGNVQLESKMHALNQKLEDEGEQLKIAYSKLEDSQQKLVHQEKMATLGELVAGFAHEVNNPAAALLRSSEMLKENFLDLPSGDPRSRIFEIGLNSSPLSSEMVRKRMLEVQKKFPYVKERSIIRKLAQIPEEGHEVIIDQRKKTPIEILVQQFEAGKFIHNIKVASERIANLVKSLKSYSRQDNNEAEMIDLRDGINDTILILSHRLKYLDMEVKMDEIPKTCARLGELNQVWTNILVNACDVLPDGGKLKIRTKTEGEYKIVVSISDNGPGIPDDVLPRIFEPNFTTKNQVAQFGLGLGLAISNEIIRHHGGFIRASNRENGGAKFEIILPVKNC